MSRIVASAMLSEFSGVWPLATSTPRSDAARSSKPSVPVNGEMTARRFGYVEGGACFWHMVDLLWIVLFALLYLMH